MRQKKRFVFGMLALFITVLIASPMIAPVASATTVPQTNDIEALSNVSNELLSSDEGNFENNSFPTKETTLQYLGHSNNYNIPMTKEEFYISNADYFKFLSSNLGENAARSILDEAYNESKIHEGPSLRNTLTDSIVQIQGDDVYIWPYQNTQKNMDSRTGNINAIFYNRETSQIASELRNTGHWHNGAGLNEWGLHGDNPTYMTWSSSPGLNGDYQLEDGSYFGDRYHLVLTDGDWEPNLQMNWCYGNCHYEYWDTRALTHYVHPDGWDTGEAHLKQTVQDNLNWHTIYQVDLHNDCPGRCDEWGYLYEMA
jgi:hypothetical protein